MKEQLGERKKHKSTDQTAAEDINKLSYDICIKWKTLNERYKDVEFTDREHFILWSSEHGYRPWKSIKREDNSKAFSPDNCYWEVSSRIDDRQPVEELDTPMNVYRNVKYCIYNLHQCLDCLIEVQRILNSLCRSSRIKKRSIKNMMDKVGLAGAKLDEAIKESDNIEIKGVRTYSYKKDEEDMA